MYALKNILDKSPLQITTGIMLLVNLFAGAGGVTISTGTLASINGTLIVVLGLFVSTKTANKAVLNEVQAYYNASPDKGMVG